MHDELPKNSGRAKLIRPPRRTAGPSSAPVTPQAASMLNLQRLAGNAAVTRVLEQDRYVRGAGYGQHAGVAPAAPQAAAVRHALPLQSDAVPVQRAPREPYLPGTYGYRNIERRRLEEEEPGAPISGETHQMEHAWGYAATARHARVPRSRNTRHEGEIGAYHETLAAHRAHPGTGSGTRIQSNGLSSATYRAMQEEGLRNDDPGTPLLMNQVYYNDMPAFTSATGTARGRQSDSSFRTMLDANPRTPFYDSDGERQWTRSLRPWERVDADVTRRTMRAGRELDEDEQGSIRRRYGATRIDDYPTRSRRPADGRELTSFPDLNERSPAPLRIPPRSFYPADSDSDSDGGGYSRERLLRLARTDTRYRARSPLARTRPTFSPGDVDSDSDAGPSYSFSARRDRSLSPPLRTRPTFSPGDVDSDSDAGPSYSFSARRDRSLSPPLRTRPAFRYDSDSD